MTRKKILCLSGGGARGIGQLQVLKKLEEDAGKPLCEVYDLIIGSSVGAINASLIATGKISMKDLDKTYDDLLRKVFTKREFFKKPKYDRVNFNREWVKLVGKGIKFGEAKTRLITTTVDLVYDTNIFYKSWHDDDAKEYMLDLVDRSFAAPLFFGQIVDYFRGMVYSDGGIGNANLPLNEAKLQAEVLGWYDEGQEVEIHAVGTLFPVHSDTFKKVSKGNWFTQVMDYLNPSNGGLARAQSRKDQLRMMKYICSHNKRIKFKYWDMSCEKRKLILDGVKYIDTYRYCGVFMAKRPLEVYN